MKTYQDWLKVAERDDNEKMAFIKTAINDFKSSVQYANAIIGEDYYIGRNTTIRTYEKILFNALGEAVKDIYSANHKLATRFFYRDVKQASSTLLGNGISWNKEDTGKKLGKNFDRQVLKASKWAQRDGVAYGFFNNGKVEIFKCRHFVPFIDEEDGALKAGVRFWQLASDKPLRATLYELDGYTEYMWDKEHFEGMILNPKRAYIQIKKVSPADGEEIYDVVNYPSFPIVPFYANEEKESEVIAIRQTIDAYDLINSGYANNVDDADIIYWTITNAGGMNDNDLIQYLDKMRKLHAAQLDEDQHAEPHTVNLPVEARERILDRLEKQMYKDAMALNTYDLANGAVTATQIEAAYEPLNEKLDDFETFVTEFIEGILAIASIDDEPTYDRSIIINQSETIQTVITAANYLSEEYVTEKVLTILGDKDKIKDIQSEIDENNFARMTQGAGQEENENV